MIRPWPLSITLLCMVAACASEPGRVLSARNFNGSFVCDGGEKLAVRFQPFRADLESEGLTAALAQQPSAPGDYVYTGEGHTVRASGADAIWTDAQRKVHRCRDVLASAPKK